MIQICFQYEDMKLTLSRRDLQRILQGLYYNGETIALGPTSQQLHSRLETYILPPNQNMVALKGDNDTNFPWLVRLV